MSDRRLPIARVRLARSLPRLLALPAVLLLIAGAAAVAGMVLLPMPAGLVVAVAAAVLLLVAAWWSARMLSVRLDVEEAAVHLHWLGGERRYVLTPGPVTRVRFRGDNASALRARTSWLGWQLGAARLRDEEDIEVIRLAPTETAILVPTEDGRLAIAAANEDELLDALTQAARARQLQEAVAQQVAEAAVVDRATEGPAEPEARTDADAAAPPEPDPRFMTGIQRAAYEARLAEERRAAEAAAADAEAARQEQERRAAQAAAEEPEAVAMAPEPVARPRRRWRPRIATRMERPRATVAFVLLPLAGAGAAWGIGLVSGTMPEPGSDLGRLTALALVLSGPATSIAAIMARAWWPRIIGVVVAGGLAASVFIGRALLGG